ncbi:MAG: cyclic nucleotide-binding domain-containing protein [Acidimicrobiales bacterium]
MDPSYLKKVPLFDGLSDEDVANCAALFETEEILAGAGMAREGEFAYKFFVVLEGEVDVLRDFEAVARLGPGDFFGEMGLLGGERRNARVVAHTRCDVAWMMGWSFEEMLEQYPDVAQRIQDAVDARVAPLVDE